ncbi:unnamed protein product [Adineta ricciae]|uniref:Uncharacterized protein n=1 Tax=Adineta ricciae TaxID=249248 RepID=A0A814TNW1_ADIRI|nr:unnamed protein product [Adineta ricciae]CAF1163851.1 unnamed protein product [Adineta ricciae]
MLKLKRIPYVWKILLCFLLVARTNGVSVKKVSSMDDDANELARLVEMFWSLKPDVLQRQGPLVLCEFIDQYCATATSRMRAISVMISSIVNDYHSRKPYNQVLNVCVNSTGLESIEKSSSLLQRLISPMITNDDKLNIRQYRRVILNYTSELNDLISYMNKSCNAEEIHALVCLSNTELIKRCTLKMLRDMHDQSTLDIYEDYIQKTKDIFTDINIQLSMADKEFE